MRPGSRRAFFLGAGAAAGAVVAVTTPAAARAGQGRRVHLLTTYVAGIGRHAPAALAAQLSAGEAVALRREPDSRYDVRAVSVWTLGGDKLGYVPRIDNQALANLMDAGLAPQARVLSVAGDGKRPEVSLEVAVSLGA